jgi:hypothetical protein
MRKNIPHYSGGSRGGAPGEHPPKIEKIWFFGVKSWFFTRNTQFFLSWNPGSAPALSEQYQNTIEKS